MTRHNDPLTGIIIKMPGHDRQRWTGAILAGGRARRYGGRDKTSLLIGGRTILEHQTACLHRIADSILLVTNDRDRFVPPPGRVVWDLVCGAGALGGLLTAVSHAATPWTLVLAGDMPFVTASFLATLCVVAEEEQPEAVVPRSVDGLQPLCAAYSAAAVDAIRRQIDERSLKLTDLVLKLRVREIPFSDIARSDPRGTLFFNINSPEDYERAVELSVMQQSIIKQ
ncbi:MAG: molybdenum cofactor guanylyltransferase [Acidobacteria bacterium]|nr:molybdenum cofactor guanylyltransferase [Acidobacteriota bacterium]